MAGRSVAGRRHTSWEKRFRSGLGAGGEDRHLAGRGAGWEIFSYLAAGMAFYGGIGWLIGRAVHIQLLFPIGMLIGITISLGWIIYRYGRQ
jgi:ATP synthase protein I